MNSGFTERQATIIKNANGNITLKTFSFQISLQPENIMYTGFLKDATQSVTVNLKKYATQKIMFFFILAYTSE